ncbi:MAG: type II 3-dehydroquinate dehydratase [Deltaproteobacteria bacterium]|nr:type II 3-dehydroquinate dehydratase [Deltaproteobacteria bacterium]
MRLAHLLVLHGPHHDLLGEAPLADQPALGDIDRALELAASVGVAGVRSAQGNSEAELVAALHRNRDWATHVLVSPGALAPTAYVLREALALAKLPYAELFLDAFPGAADHARRSVLREGAELQKRGNAPAVYIETAEKLLKAKFNRAATEALASAVKVASAKVEPSAGPRLPPPVTKEVGRKVRNEVASQGRVQKTIGRSPPKAAEAAPVRSAAGITRALVKAQISNRLARRITSAELAVWGREQWLAVERGAATESGQRELLSEALQALALSSVPGATLSEPELLEWMARMG